MRAYLITTVTAFLLMSNLNAQTIKTEKKTIKYTNGLSVFYLCVANPISITYENDNEYFWYNSDFNKIKSSKGGCGGKLLHGNYKFYDEEGNLKADVNYYLGQRNGDGKQWDEEGHISEITHYTKGVCDYIKYKSDSSDYWIEWNGEPIKNGSVKKWYTSYGRLIQEEVQLSLLTFKITEYFYSGKIKQQFTHTNALDLMKGDWIEYYENGNKKSHGIFDDEGFRIGEWKWFNEDGSIDHSVKYKKETEKYANGKIKSQGSYSSYIYGDFSGEWTKSGIWYFYKEDGKFDHKEEY